MHAYRPHHSHHGSSPSSIPYTIAHSVTATLCTPSSVGTSALTVTLCHCAAQHSCCLLTSCMHGCRHQVLEHLLGQPQFMSLVQSQTAALQHCDQPIWPDMLPSTLPRPKSGKQQVSALPQHACCCCQPFSPIKVVCSCGRCVQSIKQQVSVRGHVTCSISCQLHINAKTAP